MKFIFKSIFIFILFTVSLLIFLPKIELFNLVEKQLQKHNIVLSQEQRVEKLFGLKLNGCEVYYDGINVSLIKEINLNSFIFYNNLEVKNIRVSNSFKNMIPSKIDSVNFNYSVLKLNKIIIKSNGEFGEFNGEVKIFENKITGELIPSNEMKSKYRNILKEFKLVEGRYFYELKF